MSTPPNARGTDFEGDAKIRQLNAEVETLRLQISQRENLLTQLNRRLLHLEGATLNTADCGNCGELEGDNRRLRQELDECRTEISNLHQTKVFRWSNPARHAYAKLRRSL